MTRNFDLPYIPERASKPRKSGVTMMMDKGMSLSETAAFIEGNHEYTDLAKFGFGTSMITPNLKEKIKLYKEAGIRP
ncbi:MAG: phosphosulfolactate synthase, partial [Bacteroidota bacterium]